MWTSGSTTSRAPSPRSKRSAASVVRAPGMYAPEGTDVLEWAVMQDPFGNEFCIIRYPLD